MPYEDVVLAGNRTSEYSSSVEYSPSVPNENHSSTKLHINVTLAC